MSVNVAIMGATGAVGAELLELLDERNFPIKSLKLLASARSAGKEVVNKCLVHYKKEAAKKRKKP